MSSAVEYRWEFDGNDCPMSAWRVMNAAARGTFRWSFSDRKDDATFVCGQYAINRLLIETRDERTVVQASIEMIEPSGVDRMRSMQELRSFGLSFRQIGLALGISGTRVAQLLKKAEVRA